MNEAEPLVLIVSGPSGSGKSTLVKKLLQLPGTMLSVSCTTRSPRETENDGKWYNFVSEAEFHQMVTRGEFLEYAQVFGKNWYGTPRKWLDEARALTDTMVKFHADKDGRGFFYTSSDHEKLFARAKDQYDGAQPSGNSVAARNLVRLWTKTGDDRYRELAEKTLRTFAGSLKANPSSLTSMADALGLYLDAKK